mgnify:CR=1 FL=1
MFLLPYAIVATLVFGTSILKDKMNPPELMFVLIEYVFLLIYYYICFKLAIVLFLIFAGLF